MNNGPRETLRNLIARYGHGLCSDAKRCENLLRDLCGPHRREVNILTGALRERVPLDLLAAQSTMPRGLLLARLTRRLEDQLAFTEEAARWAVESWALALGVVTDRELEEEKRKQVEATVKPEAVATPARAPDDASRLRKPSPPPNTTPPASGRQQPTRSPAPRPPINRRPSSAPAPAPPKTTPTARAGPTVPYTQAPAGRSTATRPSYDPNALQPTDPSLNTHTPGRRGFKLRGCLVGCLLLILLSSILFLVAPYVVSVLKEEQERRTNEPPRVPSR